MCAMQGKTIARRRREGDAGEAGEAATYRHDVLDQTVEEVGAVLDIHVNVGKQGAQAIEDGVEVLQNAPPSDLGDVVQALASVVSAIHNTCVNKGTKEQRRKAVAHTHV